MKSKFNFINFLFGIIILGSILVPIIWMFMTSLKKSFAVIASPWSFPTHPQWINYVHAWNQGGIGHALFNTTLIASITLIILLPIGAMTAYILAKYPFKGSQTIFGLYLGGMMFPFFLVMVPLFELMTQFHLYDTKTGLILIYVAYSLSFTVFVLNGFFQMLPNELMEAAMLDGCSDHRTFWAIMMPLARPGMLVVGVFNAIGLWNEFALAFVLMPSSSNRTLPLAIANLSSAQQYESDWGALFAGLVIVIVPILFVYWLLRDRIHETMLAGAVKG